MPSFPRLEAILDPFLLQLPLRMLRISTAVVGLALAVNVVVPDIIPLLDEAAMAFLLWKMLGMLHQRQGEALNAPARPSPTSPHPQGKSPPQGGIWDATSQGLKGAKGSASPPPPSSNSTTTWSRLDPRVWRVDSTLASCRKELKQRHGLPADVDARLNRLEQVAREEQKRLKRLENLLEGTLFDPWGATQDVEKARAALRRAGPASSRSSQEARLEAALARAAQVDALLECRERTEARLLQLLHQAGDLHARLTLLDLDDPEKQAELHAIIAQEVSALERVPDEIKAARQEVRDHLERRVSSPSTALVRLLHA